MWTTQASAVTKGSPEDVWRLWADVGTWPKWDDGIEWCRMDGPFREGSRGEMKPKGGPKVKFQLLAAEPNRGFRDRSFLPLTHLEFTHSLEPLPEGTRITHQVRFSGPLSFLFRRVVGLKIATGLPGAVQRLADLAGQRGAVAR